MISKRKSTKKSAKKSKKIMEDGKNSHAHGLADST
jgi:hypothetical protein